MNEPQTQTENSVPLTGFRRRIRLLRAWRLGAICGLAGACAAAVMATLDLFSIVYFDPWMLAAFTLAGILVGVSRALTEPLPDDTVARSVDRRGGLADRLTTVVERAGEPGWRGAVREDAAAHLSDVRASAVYPVRFGRWQGAFVGVAVLAALLYAAGNSDLFRTAQQRKDAATLRAAALQVAQVVKPELDVANTKNASPEDRQLARELRKFTEDLNKGRMSKAEALQRANQLAEEAEKLEQQRSNTLNESVQKAQTAQQALEQMAGLNNQQMQSMTPQQQMDAMRAQADRLNSQASQIQNQMDEIQRELESGNTRDGQKLSDKMRADLEKQMQELAKMMSQIKLSQKALDFLNKLEQNPAFQQAMDIMQKLADNNAATSSGNPPTLTQQQMEQMAKQLEAEAKALEEMAKQNDSDGQIAQLAQQMLMAALQARMGNPGMAQGMMASLGLFGQHMNGPSGPGPEWDRWRGYTNKPPMSAKSSLLKGTYDTHVITSQIGDKGDETYVQVTGPSMPTGKTSVPYEAVLPKYEKTAETAVDRADIPPNERQKVRDYFNSLRQ